MAFLEFFLLSSSGKLLQYWQCSLFCYIVIDLL